jgi:hypothetical protein
MVVDRRVLLLVVRGASIFALALLVTWLALPSPIGSAAWIPSPAPPLDGPYWANDALTHSERRFADLPGVDDVVFDESGRGYASVADGRVVRLEGNSVVEVANTGGRPMGLALSPTDGLLYVCDADRGLLSIDVERKVVNVVVDTAEGAPFRFVNDIAIDRRGVVYFTDASAVWRKDQLLEDVLDQRPTGRVLRYERASSPVLLALCSLPTNAACWSPKLTAIACGACGSTATSATSRKCSSRTCRAFPTTSHSAHGARCGYRCRRRASACST